MNARLMGSPWRPLWNLRWYRNHPRMLPLLIEDAGTESLSSRCYIQSDCNSVWVWLISCMIIITSIAFSLSFYDTNKGYNALKPSQPCFPLNVLLPPLFVLKRVLLGKLVEFFHQVPWAICGLSVIMKIYGKCCRALQGDIKVRGWPHCSLCDP